jgi:hypothetical protein
VLSGVPPYERKDMPPFAAGLGDHDIRAVLAFIKSRWPVGTRASQAMLNPHQEGMPNAVGDWRFPPSCSVAPWRIGRAP